MSTKQICPACRGSLTDKMTGTKCMYCKGAKVVSSETALNYATMLERQAMAGMVSGLMGKDEAEGMYLEAKLVRRAAGV